MAKTWLITGSSRGLGRALAEAVLAAGHQLVATARKPDDLGDLVARYGDQVRAVALDVTEPAAARRAVGVATSVFGRLDVVVNNAGYANVSSVEDMADRTPSFLPVSLPQGAPKRTPGGRSWASRPTSTA
jgi:NAD(P)-dependent dehydrogenase (short-subunit alcohol dehydrogenase family)